MKKFLLAVSVMFLGYLSLSAQNSFTNAYQKFRPYHYQTPQGWNRIRLEVLTHGCQKWPLIPTEQRDMRLAGGWKGLIPSPVPENTYFFKDIDQLSNIYSLILTPGAYGYVVYPYKIEEQFKLSENELLKKYISAKGFMNTLVSDVPYETEKKLDELIYTSDTTLTELSTEPEIYDESHPVGEWLKEAEYYDYYNVKNFYCYFDNRPDTLKQRQIYTTRVTQHFQSEVDSLTSALQRASLAYVIVPYWMTDVYLSQPVVHTRKISRLGYPGYIINPVTGMPELTNNWDSPNVMDFYPYDRINYDLVAYCGDALSTNRFLSNPAACRRFIYTVFGYPSGMIRRPHSIHKPSGLNVYLPEFDFKDKRALAQFVKSLSLVIDSFRVDTTHVYEKLDLSLTFSHSAGIRNSGFIAGLQCFVDTVYFADFDSLGLASKVIYSDGSIDTSSVISLVSNPFYLFRIPFKQIQPGINDTNVWELSNCDYASGQWGLFFCIDLCLLLSIAGLMVMRYISPTFNLYVERYHTFIVLLMITLVIEFAVFFFFMVEALSPQVIFFDLETGNMTYLALIALPVLPILLYFFILKLNNREQLP